VSAVVPDPFVHFLLDDFSPGDEGERLEQLVSRDERRRLLPCRHLGDAPPNLGAGLAWVWEYAQEAYDGSAEALLSVESDVVVRPGAVEACRKAVAGWGERAGAIAPLYTEVGGSVISTFGGMTDEPLDFCGHRRGEAVAPILQSPMLCSALWWAHLACLWVPRQTLQNRTVRPDPAFRLYYQDHDLCHQVRHAGLDVVLCDHAVAEHTRGNASTGLLLGEGRQAAEALAYEQLKRKWAGVFF
jgi:GT2 family glycosyltransferase